MTSKPCITIVGTGLIGASIGMAIRQRRGDDLEVLGHDKDPGRARLAKKMGAIDKAEWNLISACSKADMIVLAIPASGIRETLEIIANDLKSDCVITDTSSLKANVLQWADELLPPEVSFVGGDPILFGDEAGLESARADLFANRSYCICPSPRATSEGVKLVSDMVAMLGAVPHYIDPYEHDGLIGGTEHLADVLSTTLLRTLSSSSGWRDMRRMGGATFDRVTAFSMADAAEYRDRALLNRDNVLRWIDAFQQELSNFRGMVAREDGEAIENYYQAEMETRQKWLQDQATQNWDGVAPQTPLPTTGEFFSQMLLGGLGRRRTGK